MWKVDGSFLTQKPLVVALIGVGGTGSELASNLVRLHQALRAFGYGGLHVVAFDPDIVAPANIVRQRYAAADMNQNKAQVLINRINLACSLGWAAVPKRFSASAAGQKWDIVISCVDNRKSREQLHRWAFGKGIYKRWKLWIDTGNDATTGQVIVGTPRPNGERLQHHLPCATELHPELRDTTLPDDTQPSCSAIEALQRQDLYVNTMVANLAAQLLWQLVKHGGLHYHGIYFDLERYTFAPLPVPPKTPRRTRSS